MENENKLFKCANELKVTIVQDNGEVILQEDCCTNLSILVKNNGEMATSFLGAHSPEMIRVLEKTLKQYFKTLKKTLKAEYRRSDNEEIKVVKGSSEKNSKEIEEALSKEVEVDIKYEFESLKEIEEDIKKRTTKKSTTNSKTSNKKPSSVKNTKSSTISKASSKSKTNTTSKSEK